MAAWGWRMTPEGARRDGAPGRCGRRPCGCSTTPTNATATPCCGCSPRRSASRPCTRWPTAGRRVAPWLGRAHVRPVARWPEPAQNASAGIVELVVATDLLVWKLLRREMGLDRGAAERIVTEMVTAVERGALMARLLGLHVPDSGTRVPVGRDAARAPSARPRGPRPHPGDGRRAAAGTRLRRRGGRSPASRRSSSTIGAQRSQIDAQRRIVELLRGVSRARDSRPSKGDRRGADPTL